MKKVYIFLFFLISINSIPKTENPQRKLQDTRSDDIIILHTNDVHCGLQDHIGYDGLALYKRILEKSYKNVILADAGDHIQGGIYGLITKGEAIIDIMNKLKYDVATLGNHEFDYGVEQLEKVRGQLKCGYISINYCYRRNKTAIYPSYKIVRSGGKNIAFIGVATPQTLSKTGLITQYDESGNLIYYFMTDNQSRELYNNVQAAIDKAKAEGADYVIILAHLGYGGDALEENTSIGLLRNIKGVDALIDGHTHLVYNDRFPDKSGNNVLIVQTGTKLANIGVLKISVADNRITHEMINAVPNPEGMPNEVLGETYKTGERDKKNVYFDKEMSDYIQAIVERYKGELDRKIGYTSFILNVFELSSDRSDRGTQLSRSEESILCNLVTDAIRYYGEGDVTIMNAGSVRVDLDAGDITYQKVVDMMPFSNDILVKEVTGQTILDALEHGVRTLPDKTSRFPQVSGITYKIDTSIPSSVILDSSESFVRVAGKRRVYDVKVNGERLKLLKTYTLATNSFIIEGGDGYSMFKDFEVVKTSAGVDNEVVLNYIENDLKGVIPDKYRQTEGRIVKTNGRIYSENIDNNGSLLDNKIILLLLVLAILF